MSTVRTDNFGPSAGGTTYSARGIAKAWVNFDGTGTIAARDSENVSSLTDNGTGDYTLNFSSAFGAGDYAPTCMMQSDATRELTIRSGASDSAAPDLMSGTQLRVAVYTNSAGNSDVATICVSINGDLA
jgi:hypothetical protein